MAQRTSAFLAHLNEQGDRQTLEDHLLSVSRLAAEYADKVSLGPAGELVGLLHDLGKYSEVFQRYLGQVGAGDDTEGTTLKRGSVDHSTAGAQWVWQQMGRSGGHVAVAGQILSLCIASHHSGLIDCIAPDGTDTFTRRMDKALAETHLPEVSENIDSRITEAIRRLMTDTGIADAITEAIRRVYARESTKQLSTFNVGLLVRFLFSCLIDADRTDTAAFASPATQRLSAYPTWEELGERLDAHIAAFSCDAPVNRIRSEVSSQCARASTRPRGAYTLTVPTGGGKTLASLRFAMRHAAQYQMDRVIYVSPYTSIIDQNAGVVRSILEPQNVAEGSIVLEHHCNLAPHKLTTANKLLSENWDAPVVFTTAVQFLDALFGSGTRSVRRLHQMANTVIVMDEAQTLPIRCVHLFNNAANFLVDHCNSTLLLCTATQPLLHKVNPKKGSLRLAAQSEIIQDVSALFADLRRNEFDDLRRPAAWTPAEAAELALQEVRRAGSCLMVVNTKAEARAVYQCSRAQTQVPIFHLSTNMCAAHRLDVLAQIRTLLEKRQPVVCVSTQLIEAGVDISFGAAIRALAGLDSIVQTAGRCNRHSEFQSGRVSIINFKEPLPPALKDICTGQDSAQRVLDDLQASVNTPELADPENITAYFQYFFFERSREMDYPLPSQKIGRNDTLLSMLSDNTLALGGARPEISLRQSFMSAANVFDPIDASTQGVIVPYRAEGAKLIAQICSESDVTARRALLRKAQRYSVNLFQQALVTLERAGAAKEAIEGSGILYLTEAFYSEEIGVSSRGCEEMELLIA